MPTRVHLASLREIENELLELAADDAELFVSDAELFLQKQFERTFKHWARGNPSDRRGANKYGIPRVEFFHNIKKERNRGISIEINALVIGDNGGAHVLWHWLTFGTKAYKPPKNIRFPIRKNTRTRPRQLDAKPFPGYDNPKKWVTITPAKGRKGIQAREWYEAIYDEFRKYLARNRGSIGSAEMVYFTKRVRIEK